MVDGILKVIVLAGWILGAAKRDRLLCGRRRILRRHVTRRNAAGHRAAGAGQCGVAGELGLGRGGHGSSGGTIPGLLPQRAAGTRCIPALKFYSLSLARA